MTVSVLLEQPRNKSDNPIKFVTNLLTACSKLGPATWKKQCERNLPTVFKKTCYNLLQVCYNLCVFTRVKAHVKFKLLCVIFEQVMWIFC